MDDATHPLQTFSWKLSYPIYTVKLAAVSERGTFHCTCYIQRLCWLHNAGTRLQEGYLGVHICKESEEYHKQKYSNSGTHFIQNKIGLQCVVNRTQSTPRRIFIMKYGKIMQLSQQTIQSSQAGTFHYMCWLLDCHLHIISTFTYRSPYVVVSLISVLFMSSKIQLYDQGSFYFYIKCTFHDFAVDLKNNLF